MRIHKLGTGKGGVAMLAVILALAMTGCAKASTAGQPGEAEWKAETPAQAESLDEENTEKEQEAAPKKKDEAENPDAENIEKEQEPAPKDAAEANAEGQPAAAAEELNGTVRSVGADSFVISKINVEHHEDYDIAVSVADGAAGEELITVYVTDNAVYQYLTVKNSGINPEDITSREGSYGDLQEGLTVILKGYWEKDSFYADELEIEMFT